MDGSYQYGTFYETVNISSEVLIFLCYAKVAGLQKGVMKLLQSVNVSLHSKVPILTTATGKSISCISVLWLTYDYNFQLSGFKCYHYHIQIIWKFRTWQTLLLTAAGLFHSIHQHLQNSVRGQYGAKANGTEMEDTQGWDTDRAGLLHQAKMLQVWFWHCTIISYTYTDKNHAERHILNCSLS